LVLLKVVAVLELTESPSGEHYLFESPNEFHKASCSSLYLQCGVQEDNSNVFIDLVSQILSEPCYNVLRTQEQLGYIVFSGVRKANGAKGLRILVQSTKHPQYVEGRIEKFLGSMVVSLVDFVGKVVGRFEVFEVFLEM
jgi:insulysin